MNQKQAENALREAIEKLDRFLPKYQDSFPDSQSEHGVYPAVKENRSWTTSFYPGMLWIAYEYTGNKQYLPMLETFTQNFINRIEQKYCIDTHDLGFLYSLSCIADYKVTGNENAKQAAVSAADALLLRYKPKGKFLQAWGSIDDPDNYRLIIDCLMNLPLLYWATSVTGNETYTEIACNHLESALRVLIRPDFSTYHTHYFDPETGEPTQGTTFQGYSDDSCWARGQAWGIYGIALSYLYTKEEKLLPLYRGVADYFKAHLPQDNIPFWDMIFTDGDEQPRDTSAATIAASGMLLMDSLCGADEDRECAEKILESLYEHYTTRALPDSDGLLTDGMYNRNAGHVPECTIFGDYYYMEALMRVARPDWKGYW